MGSLNNGQPIRKDQKTTRHLGHILNITSSDADLSVTSVSNSGSISTVGANTRGVHFAPGGNGTHTSGIALNRREVDNSVNRQLFTETGQASGYLSWDYTRKISGEHVSVSTVRAPDALGPTQSDTERKVFFVASDRGKSSNFADWTIFNAAGVAVGASGTTDTDVTPTATFDA
jgi:hypothetical protein